MSSHPIPAPGSGVYVITSSVHHSYLLVVSSSRSKQFRSFFSLFFLCLSKCLPLLGNSLALHDAAADLTRRVRLRPGPHHYSPHLLSLLAQNFEKVLRMIWRV